MINKSISVVLPCFNEAGTIRQNITKIYGYLSNNFEKFEIIAVNDGSRDTTSIELEKIKKVFPIIVIDNKINEGKGKAVKEGILASHCEIVMFLDADLAIPIEGLPDFITELENGYDLAIASRFVPGLKVIKPILWYRKILERIFRLIRIIIIDNWEIRDTQCGFKVFSRMAAMDIFPYLTIKRFAFDAEIIFIASSRGLKIKELPIILQNPTRSSIRIFRDSANMINDLMKIKRNSLIGKYKKQKSD